MFVTSPVVSGIKRIKWKLNTLRQYSDSAYFQITPSFLVKELFSRRSRLEHFKAFEHYKINKRFERLNDEEKAQILDAQDFAHREFSVVPDMGRFELMNLAIQSVTIPGLWLEFGVYKGESLNYIASKTDKSVHGFDSFLGLPEDWNSEHKKGHFRVKNGKVPRVKSNVILHKGWFNKTLPEFIDSLDKEGIALMHIDCDLYSSAKEVFDKLGDRIHPGTVILFDEYYNYPGWRENEFRVFNEYCLKNGVRFEYIGYNSQAEQTAVKIVTLK